MCQGSTNELNLGRHREQGRFTLCPCGVNSLWGNSAEKGPSVSKFETLNGIFKTAHKETTVSGLKPDCKNSVSGARGSSLLSPGVFPQSITDLSKTPISSYSQEEKFISGRLIRYLSPNTHGCNFDLCSFETNFCQVSSFSMRSLGFTAGEQLS